MSILNVNTIQPIGSGTTVTVAATELKTSNFITVGTGASVTSPSANVLTLGTNNAERLRITSAGLIGIGTANPGETLHLTTTSGNCKLRIDAASAASVEFYNSGTRFSDMFTDAGTGNFTITNRQNADIIVRTNGSNERLRIDNSGRLGLGVVPEAFHSNNKAVIRGDSGYSILGRGNNALNIGQNFYYDSSDAGKYIANGEASVYQQADGQHVFYSAVSGSANAGASLVERLRITNAGIIQCGTSATLKAEINNSVSGHQFISQCSDNNNGFEVYQQHGSNTTRNNFAVYANTGSGNAKNLQFAVRGDGAVTKPTQPLAIIGTTQNNWSPNAGDTLPFDYNNTNRGNHYNTSNYTFTCPVAGDYMVILRLSRKGWCGDLELAKNNSQYVRLELRETGRNNSNNADWQAWCYDFIVPCAANDTLKWKAPSVYTGTGGGNYLLDGYNHIYYDSATYYLIG